MAMRSLERLEAFALARDLAVRVYGMTRRQPLRSHWGLSDQIGRAVVSIPANIAEAHALGTRRQVIRGLRIAYGSALELETLLGIASRVGALPSDDETTQAVADLDRVLSMLVGLLKYHGARVGG